MIVRYPLLVGALLFSVLLHAQTRYVDDTLYLGFYKNSDGSGGQFSSVPGGTKLELLEERPGYSLVRTEKGTEGWVKTKYLVEMPLAVASVAVREQTAPHTGVSTGEREVLSDENVQLRKQVDSLSSQLLKARNERKKNAVATEARATADQQRLRALRAALADALQVLQGVAARQDITIGSAVATTKPIGTLLAVDISTQIGMREMTPKLAWGYVLSLLQSITLAHYILLGIALSIGFLLGVFVLDRRIRSRHGGYRLW